MSYRVRLEVFDGPLDLLLYLIKKEELDICNIAVSQITDQYLEYVEIMQALDLELAGEFILIAATLMHIKSKALLPEDEQPQEEEEEDAAISLLEQLKEYRKYKEAADSLEKMELEQHKVFTRPSDVSSAGEDDIMIDVSLFDLIGALSEVLSRLKDEPETEIVRDETTVKEKIDFIISLLENKEMLNFTVIFSSARSKVEAIVIFLALLELIKIQKVRVKQQSQFGEILIEAN